MKLQHMRWMLPLLAWLLMANAAKAGVIVTVTRIPYNSGTGVGVYDNGNYDEIDFTISSFNGADNTEGPVVDHGTNPAQLLDLIGTFSAVGTGAVLAVPGDNTSTDKGYWEKFINGQTTPGNAIASFVNLADLNPVNVSRSGSGTQTTSGSKLTDIYGTSASLSGEWFSTSPDGVQAGTLLASIFVTPGADVSFNGEYATYDTITPFKAVTFTSAVPEPASLSLLTLGALGLLSRRRTPKA